MLDVKCQEPGGAQRLRAVIAEQVSFRRFNFSGPIWSQSCQSGANVVHGQKEGHIMPNRDGTGPKNQGSQSGQGGGKGQKQKGPGCRRGPKDGTGPGSGAGRGRGQGAGKEDATDKSSKES